MSHLENDCGDHDAEKEREFCVRDIPPNVDDWAVFHVFKRYGVVENVRIPVTQAPDSPRYCFVSMGSVEGAAKVRSMLNNGRLQVGNHWLRVNDARGTGSQNKKAVNGRGQQPNRNGYQQRRSAEAKTSSYLKIQYPTADLPLGEVADVRVVPSPFPSVVEDGLTFHVINMHKVPGEAYTELQQAMNTHCHSQENACGSVEIGEPVMFYRQDIAYRAIQNKPDTVYLVDMGREERVMSGKLFRMLHKFAVLPALVTTCSLARVIWSSAATDLFNSVRQIIEKWCETEGCLKARVEYFRGNTNMIHLEGTGNTNLTKSLAKRGDLTIVNPTTEHTYSREDMYRIQKELEKNPYRVNIDRHAESIVQPRNGLSSAMADLVI